MTQPIAADADHLVPQADEYAPYYDRYIARVRGRDLLATLREQREALALLPQVVPPERETFRYTAGKWSVREVVGHLGDGERVFGYRAFCISRGDQASLPGFDENAYVERSGFADRPLADLAAELVALRDANLGMFGALTPEAWQRVGTANGLGISTRALAWVAAGHVDHHLALLRERYGIAV